MVRKIGQFLLNAHGGGEGGPSTFPLSNFRAKQQVQSLKFSH